MFASPQLLALLQIKADHLKEAAWGEVLVHDVSLHHPVARHAVELQATEGAPVPCSQVLLHLLLHHLHLLLHLAPLLPHLCFHCLPFWAPDRRHLLAVQSIVVASTELLGILMNEALLCTMCYFTFTFSLTILFSFVIWFSL